MIDSMQGYRRPTDPLRAICPCNRVTSDEDPIVVICHRQTDPKPGNSVDVRSKPRIRAKLGDDRLFDQPDQRPVGKWHNFVVRFERINSYTFIGSKLGQQVASHERICIQQCGARDADDGYHLLRDGLRARTALEHAITLQPRREARDDQQQHQQQRAPEQRRRSHQANRAARRSGMKT